VGPPIIGVTIQNVSVPADEPRLMSPSEN